MGSLAHRLPGGVQAQGRGKVADAGLGLALGVGNLPVIHTPWVVSSVARH